MAKGNVGLPSEFKINVEKPVDLGDYLDETSEKASSGPKLRKESSPQVLAPEVEKEEEGRDKRKESSPKEVIQLAQKQTPVTPTKKRKTIRRKQINMSPKTLEHFGELVTYVQEYSQQPDAAASEVMEAIISAHHDAMSRLRLGSVPARGRWGSPTAQAFKDALSKAFSEALVEYYSETSSEQLSNG